MLLPSWPTGSRSSLYPRSNPSPWNSSIRHHGAVHSRALGRAWLLEPSDRPELVMTLPRSVSEVIAERVVFEVECIDRMYLNVCSFRRLTGGCREQTKKYVAAGLPAGQH